MPGPLLTAWSRTLRAAPRARAVVDAAAATVATRRDVDDGAAAWAAPYGEDLVGCRVLFAEPNGAGWLHVFLGLLKAGAIPVPLDPGEPAGGLRLLAQSVRGDFLWTGGALERIGAHRPGAGGGLVKLTSGSTGFPRALIFGGKQMLADGAQICATMGVRPTDLNLALIPLGHSYGLGNLALPLLAQGTALLCGAPILPHPLAAAIQHHRPTVFPAVPALVRMLAGSEISAHALRSLRLVISAGAPLSADAAQSFHARFGIKVHNFYGSTETGGIAYDRTGWATLTGRSAGTPLRGVRLSFGPGQRFTVVSAAVFTRKPRQRIGRHRPADRARLDARGELVLLGRAGRMVKIAGRRLNPAEVERALRQLPGIQDAFVAAHPRRPESLAAVIAGEISAQVAARLLEERLAPWKIPRKILALREFPLTARGKADTRRLLALLASTGAVRSV